METDTIIPLTTIKKRAISGVVTLAGRTVFLQLIGVVATFLLTIFLSPSQWGIFAIVSAFVSFLIYFSDIGLAGALIQKKEQPTQIELKTTFTVQNSLSLILLAVVLLATPLYQGWYHLDQEAVYLVWALAISLVMASLMSIPSVLLERKLDFNKLVIPQLVGQILYQIIAVILAWQGFGITSFTVAVLLRGFSSLIMMYLIQPWKPGISLDISSIKELLRFGVPFQINTFLAVAKDDGMTVFLGGILGTGNMGLLYWAQKWSTQVLRLVMDPVTRVTFPAFSRMQEHPEELSKAVSKSVLFICMLVFPALTVLVLIAPDVINLIPKYQKWQPALLALSLLSINTAWAAIATPLTNTLNAIGKIKTTFRLMVMWTTLSWLLIPGLAYLWGINGAALGYAIVGTSSVFAIMIANRSVKIDIIESVGKPIVGSIVMAVVILLVQQVISISSWTNVLLLSGLSLIVYMASVYILIGPPIVADFKMIVAHLTRKKHDS